MMRCGICEEIKRRKAAGFPKKMRNSNIINTKIPFAAIKWRKFETKSFAKRCLHRT